MLFAELTNESIGWIIAAVVFVALLVYLFVNVAYSAKPELGSELEIAPNRKAYLPDEELEGRKLDKTLTVALLTLAAISIGLPLYWILEPGRQSGAAEDFNAQFVKRGAAMFAPTGDNLQALNCAGCHGPEGVGGSAPFNLTQPDGSIEVVTWKAPALNTVLLRYSRAEVEFILTYGRPFSPMPAWGLAGGGPLNAQQIQNLVDYLESIQLPPEEAQAQAEEALAEAMAATGPDGEPLFESEGEALFNLGIEDGFAGGSYACGRCHTPGWSYATSYEEVKDVSGTGALGPALTDIQRQFPEAEDHVEFVTNGSEVGVRYGDFGQGSGKMPGFGLRPEEPALFWINKNQVRDPGPGMLSLELIEAIVEYERSLR